MNQLPKTTLGWAWSKNEAPDIHSIKENRIGQEPCEVVVMWAHDYEALKKELRELRKKVQEAA